MGQKSFCYYWCILSADIPTAIIILIEQSEHMVLNQTGAKLAIAASKKSSRTVIASADCLKYNRSSHQAPQYRANHFLTVEGYVCFSGGTTKASAVLFVVFKVSFLTFLSAFNARTNFSIFPESSFLKLPKRNRWHCVVAIIKAPGTIHEKTRKK